MATKRSKKRTTQKTAVRGAKKKPVAKKASPKKAVAKANKAATKKPAKKAAAAARPSPAKPPSSPHSPDAFPRFVWVDMFTSDAAASKTFYSSLMNWTAKDVPTPGQGGAYTMLSSGGEDFGGIGSLSNPAEKPSWMPYILVNNVEQTVRDAEKLGATVLRQPMEIPTVGRFAVVQDPAGGIFSPMSFVQPPKPPGQVNLFGPVAWMDLVTDNPQRALDFYGQLFGWKGVTGEDPVFGKYYEFEHDGHLLGGVLPRPPMMTTNTFVPYFLVPDVDVFHETAISKGSRVVIPPSDLAGIGRFSWVLDPQDVMITLWKWA
jgi:uncharacterized protein